MWQSFDRCPFCIPLVPSRQNFSWISSEFVRERGVATCPSDSCPCFETTRFGCTVAVRCNLSCLARICEVLLRVLHQNNVFHAPLINEQVLITRVLLEVRGNFSSYEKACEHCFPRDAIQSFVLLRYCARG